MEGLGTTEQVTIVEVGLQVRAEPCLDAHCHNSCRVLCLIQLCCYILSIIEVIIEGTDQWIEIFNGVMGSQEG